MTQAAATQPESQAFHEVAFEPQELFISRTDERGVIQSANGIFHRLSGYDWDRLLGAPHKIVRHPDMPRGVFHLFWERLKSGLYVGAYVKNREASGRYYWVFAVALPVTDGYVSVRLKPTSSLFAKIRDLYADLRRAESEDDIAPDDSSRALTQRLCAMGFDGYEDFMAAALCAEFTARARVLSRPLERGVADGHEMADASRIARAHADRIAQLFDEIRNVPTNIRILATQLEEGSGPIGVISTNYTTISEEMLSGVQAFRQTAADAHSAIGQGLFLSSAAALLREFSHEYAKENSLPGQIDVVAEARVLADASRACSARAADAMVAITAEARRFAEVTAALKRNVAGLDVTRIMCKIENARFRSGTSGLAEIIDNLEEVQAQIGIQLTEIEKASQRTVNTARRARGHGGA